ncbi:tyrosine-type recombinase/integrase [Tenacibaculum finnmarkense]|uniref:tyrosine-type recombinase/integrase n=1 Tax=Tenacibaculum finnmarkense TaxID=2781243 RepID=UPI000C448AE9|nr:tyrosine-type recombinase/integrase [Tenacibaculum finnmarkense]MBE7691477.1 tyrosine-type recombinase/integrase [Tenacibaculum finnmarkense genomovar finnmarkense]MCD8412613.1 tyrosine-type recombinase/integrase [Tenacibaculum finnmarkense genomovar ulcerans]MCD8439350.1 tyrosine-type recombinase/integrase [Tenacibaculum finnmarkense genomovar ulcerans]MCD8445899.1 tyrosine-type recombinase/integrase [Tenacibaculum finnmarkense genomovar finnmarkense]MCD8452926.1 tyrosine-type recombinase/
MLLTAFLDYLEHEKNYSKNTINAYRIDLLGFKDFCITEFDQENLATIHYNQIRTWIVSLIDAQISNRSVNRKMSSLKTFYTFLQKIAAIENNPMAKHKALKVQKKIQTPFDVDEIQEVIALLSEPDNFELVRNKLIVELLYSTGMRRIEMINIKEKDIDFSKQAIKVLGKRNKERYVMLLSTVLKTLKEYLILKKTYEVAGEEALLITERGAKIYEKLVYRIINVYFSKVSTKAKKSPHILRHAFATHLLNNGASLNSVKELLGHSSLASTQVYTHSSLEQIKKVYNKAHPRESK